ncbi:LPS-induced tumor necrosis factor alpha factor [Penicillium hetheringtonii]|uniref:LPS-induced tumor necrosis factor alpha factor n=1 Tax=Penicillium hetheringtonii TaxID=911720 RepID=A0AAD6E2F0_9EURO|nr:LPS-induced tumor necrosis factor alpha factor [Penicillium hetheringtonii]
MTGQKDSEGLIPLEPTAQTSSTGFTSPPVSPGSPAPPYQSVTSPLSPPPLSPTQPSSSFDTTNANANQAPAEKPRVADDIAPTVVSSSRDNPSSSYAGQTSDPNTGYTAQYATPDDVKSYPGQPQPTYQDPTQQAPNYYQPPSQPGIYYTPYGPPSGYASATPLHALQSAPAPVDCPACGHREMTRTEAVTGMTTHGWAAVLCCCCCLGCFPYLMASLKDVDHYCGKCGVKLACWHNSGRVQVMQTGQVPNTQGQGHPQLVQTEQAPQNK